MNDNGNILSQIPIKNPERWSLSLRISQREMEYLLFAPEDDNAIITGIIALDTASDNPRKAVEDAIYDNAALLGDFKMVNVLFDNDIYALVPSGAPLQAVFEASFPGFDGEMLSSSLRGDITLVYGVMDGITSFFNRTYTRCTFHHTIGVLHDFYHRKAALANSAKLYAVLLGDRIAVCCFKGGKTMLAAVNTFRHINDAAYYILAAWADAGMDPKADEVQIAGDNKERNTLIDTLRQQITFVMAAAFPASILKRGSSLQNISFDLTLAALCE